MSTAIISLLSTTSKNSIDRIIGRPPWGRETGQFLFFYLSHRLAFGDTVCAQVLDWAQTRRQTETGQFRCQQNWDMTACFAVSSPSPSSAVCARPLQLSLLISFFLLLLHSLTPAWRPLTSTVHYSTELMAYAVHSIRAGSLSCFQERVKYSFSVGAKWVRMKWVEWNAVYCTVEAEIEIEEVTECWW